MIIFSTGSALIYDINLITQIILIFLFVIGVKQKNIRKRHGVIMIIGLIANFLTFLSIMLPSFIIHLNAIESIPTSFGSIVTIMHATMGLLAIVGGFIFSIRFYKYNRQKSPLNCGSKSAMRIVLILWLGTFIFGLVFYGYYYIV